MCPRSVNCGIYANISFSHSPLHSLELWSLFEKLLFTQTYRMEFAASLFSARCPPLSPNQQTSYTFSLDNNIRSGHLIGSRQKIRPHGIHNENLAPSSHSGDRSEVKHQQLIDRGWLNRICAIVRHITHHKYLSIPCWPSPLINAPTRSRTDRRGRG